MPPARTPQEATEAGLKAHQAGQLTEAEALYRAALQTQPDFHPALYLMGILAFTRQELAAAENWFTRAIATAPRSGGGAALAGRGEVFLQMERWPEAIKDFDGALAAGAQTAATWNNRGLALNALKRFDEALDCYARALAFSPDAVQAHNNRGDTLRELRRFGEALVSFDRALALDPGDWGSLNNRAVTLTQMGRIDQARESYDRALALNPDIPAALQARGNLLWTEKSLLAPALTDLDRLNVIAPDFPYTAGNRMRLTMTAVRWQDFEKEKSRIDDGVRAGRPVIEPFIYLSLSERPEDLLLCARAYAAQRFPVQPALWQGEARKPGRIRIGYVCGEFRTHATLYLMAGLFEAHDRENFEIFAFDNSGSGNGGNDKSQLRARFEMAAEHVIDITRLSDREAASRIHGLDIDILVDLNGYSGKQRLGVFARRPAAIQVSYLAYPGTLGTPYMDYILADNVVIPEGEESFFDEKVVRLPHSYQINDDKRAITEAPDRVQAGLPADGFVFCNFNHANKFTPATFDGWMRILGRVPGSLLWLLQPDALAEANLRQEAGRRGIDPSRLVFARTLPFAEHLARLKLADLFLDGLPYGAHTTASDALWSGLPLITCRGRTFPGRVAASLLTAIGLPDLIAESAEEFENRAVELALDATRLAELRARLAENRLTTPLFDTARTTRAIEQAFRMLVERRDMAPKGFAVPPD